MMVSERINRMCAEVIRVSADLDQLTARGHSETVYAVMMRMKLAAMTVELECTDLVDRLQESVRTLKRTS